MSGNLLLHLSIYYNPPNNLGTMIFTEFSQEKWIDTSLPEGSHIAMGKMQLTQSYGMQVGGRTRGHLF